MSAFVDIATYFVNAVNIPKMIQNAGFQREFIGL